MKFLENHEKNIKMELKSGVKKKYEPIKSQHSIREEMDSDRTGFTRESPRQATKRPVTANHGVS
jgi:hypothetical protein